MFVNVDVKTSLGRQLVVPASAVMQSGTRQLVFLNHGNGSLEPKEITVGPRVADDFVVLKGLEAHQSIVTSANFLIDSESQLQAAAGSFVPPPPGAGATLQQRMHLLHRQISTSPPIQIRRKRAATSFG
jgi:Cu(I)/Ag(I) efflux system membrane fusion protein/cobalt-zinc-cadmium efflux system membrane fusion protein